jgi:hypothetical protein
MKTQLKKKPKPKLHPSGSGRGGARPNSGRHPKIDKELWGKITCILKKETIARLHTEGGEYFGEYLQHHLERYPLPSRAEYRALVSRQPLVEQIGRRKVPVIISAGGINPPKVRKPRFAGALINIEAAVAAALQ